MRILFVTMQLGRGYVHGTERYVGTLAAALRERGHEVICLAGDPRSGRTGPPLGTPVDDEASIHAYPTHGWSVVHGHSPAAVERFIAEQRPDIVHVASLAHVGCGAVVAAERLGIPVVATAMDFWWVCPRATLLRDGEELCDGSPDWPRCLRCVTSTHPDPKVRRVGRWASAAPPLGLSLLAATSLRAGGSLAEAPRWAGRRALLDRHLRRIDELIFPSPATRDIIAPRLGHARWCEIPYGLAPHWFEAPMPPLSVPRAPESLTFGFAGSLQPHKGPHLLIEALHELGWTRTRVRIAGTPDDPSYRERLEHGAEGLAVEWVGALAPEAVPGFLRTLDVFVVPSCWAENLPFALLEAQAAGLPVIASDVPGISHRVPDSRMLFDVGSASDLARAMGELARGHLDPSVPRVDTLEQMTESTLAVYDRVRARREARG